MIKLTLVTIISIISMSTCQPQPIANIESTEAGILITYYDNTGYYYDFLR